MRQSFYQSLLIHFSILGFFVIFQFIRPEPNIIWLDGPGFDFGGGGGGGGDGKSKKGGIAKKKRGQPVPQPVRVPVPDKPAPVQKATRVEEAWKIKEKNKKVKPVDKAKNPVPVAPLGEKTQQEKSNIVSIGTPEGTAETTEEFGVAGGSDDGTGLGLGIGLGPGGGGDSVLVATDELFIRRSYTNGYNTHRLVQINPAWSE